jgi:hypothetical protein
MNTSPNWLVNARRIRWKTQLKSKKVGAENQPRRTDSSVGEQNTKHKVEPTRIRVVREYPRKSTAKKV